MIVRRNDDGKKMAERDGLDPFLAEYAHVTGTVLKLLIDGERPDFVCERAGRRYGLEVVRAMQSPVDRSWDIVFGRNGRLHGLDAAILVQEVVHDKERKRASAGWQYAKSTILVVQLIGSDGCEMAEFLDEQIMNEMGQSGFREIWIADESPKDTYGTVQLIGVKPKRWRGVHRHRFYGRKPYG